MGSIVLKRTADSRLLITSLLVAASLSCARPAIQPRPPQDDAARPVIVFVHGAWAGGWHYTKVEPLLEEAGFRVFRPTMTGLGERVHLAREDVGLSTHIADIVNMLEFENLEDVVLVGHSYGGMVISGVADRVPQRIRKLIYMDAIVPESGESVMDLSGGAIETMAEAGAGGAEPWQLVPRWVKPGKLPPVDVPQSMLTFTEPIVLDNPDAANIPAVFILTIEAGKDTDGFDLFADRARARHWQVITMEGGHNPQWFQPEALVEVLLEVVGAGDALPAQG
ncbi:MAG: alpha/beta hydrolase [Acidobacteriota bacterium]|nr:alpha/beta hydrolase [Acidobacteriota bacterium]